MVRAFLLWACREFSLPPEMRLLDRYLLRELLVPLAYCVSGFLLFWTAFDLFSELSSFQDKKLHGLDIAEYYLVTAPEFLIVVLPLALLLALLYTLTHLSRHHEITAIRAAGVSLWRLSLPYFGVGLLITLASFLVGEIWAPQTTDRAEDILRRRMPKAGAPVRNQIRDFAFVNSGDRRIWKIGLYDSVTAEMRNPQVFWACTDGSRMYLKADRGGYTNGVWTFINAAQYRESSGTNSDLVPVSRTEVVAMPDFTETPEEIRSEIKISNVMSLRTVKKADIPISEIQNYLRLHPRPTRQDANWLHTKLQGRLASPWTCMVVVLIAIPFGIGTHRRNVFVGVAASISVCFAFFVVQQVSLALGFGGRLAPWVAAWSPNILFGLFGLVMTARLR